MTLNTKLALNSAILVLYFTMDTVKAITAGNKITIIMAIIATLTTVYDVVQYYYLRKEVLAEMESKNDKK